MLNLPKRRKAEKLGVRSEPQIRCDAHLRWVRGFCCSVQTEACSGKIEAAHVRTGTDGGASLKPGDNWTLPLCSWHHATQHRIGERAFEQEYGIDMKAIAQALWQRSPHRRKSST